MTPRRIVGYTMSMVGLRLLIVSANPLARGGMEAMVLGMAGVRLVGSGGLADAASLAGQLQPEAVLLDVGDGELEDLDAIARLSAAQPGLPIVAVGGGSQAVSHALAFGACAMLPAAVDPEALRLALLASAYGLVTIARSDLMSLLPADEPADVTVRAAAESLTAREIEVLQLMARGLTNRQIGRQLTISEHTVKFHAGSVLGKLNARSRAEAVARAIGLGWILV
jgi:DNA-binding NarL/FixJ family response regulator